MPQYNFLCRACKKKVSFLHGLRGCWPRDGSRQPVFAGAHEFGTPYPGCDEKYSKSLCRGAIIQTHRVPTKGRADP